MQWNSADENLGKRIRSINSTPKCLKLKRQRIHDFLMQASSHRPYWTNHRLGYLNALVWMIWLPFALSWRKEFVKFVLANRPFGWGIWTAQQVGQPSECGFWYSARPRITVLYKLPSMTQYVIYLLINWEFNMIVHILQDVTTYYTYLRENRKKG